MALIPNTVAPLPYKLVDLDQHNYESEDCFTRFMPKDKLDTAARIIQLPSGAKAALTNERIVKPAERDVVGGQALRPGSLVEMLKKRADGDPADTERFFEPIQEEYLDRDARLNQMNEQQIEKTIMYPTWALWVDTYIDDNAVFYDNVESFNRWSDDEWGFAYKDAIYAPAVLSLRDLDLAVAELDRVLAAGARFIYLAAAPACGRSPGDRYFDPFWARINEAKAVVTYHIAEYHYVERAAVDWGWKVVPPFELSAWQWQHTYGERPITETLSALIFDNLFARFPDIHVVCSEYGARWVPHFVHNMDKCRGMARAGQWLNGQLTERPSDIFKRHVRVVPYPEEDPVALADQLGGIEAFVMGSDWPHPEGMREPAETYQRIEALGEQGRRWFLRDSALEMING